MNKVKKKKNRKKKTSGYTNANQDTKENVKKEKNRLQIAIFGIFVAMAIFGVVRTQFYSTSGETVASSIPSPEIRNPGKITMLDLGATSCIPCKMMAPILEELKKEYAGRADIVFIDVRKDPAQAGKYGIRAIPTQIFFDADGKEVHRNTGFIDKKRIVEVLKRLGVS